MRAQIKPRRKRERNYKKKREKDEQTDIHFTPLRFSCQVYILIACLLGDFIPWPPSLSGCRGYMQTWIRVFILVLITRPQNTDRNPIVKKYFAVTDTSQNRIKEKGSPGTSEIARNPRRFDKHTSLASASRWPTPAEFSSLRLLSVGFL